MTELNLAYLHSTKLGYGRMGMHISAELDKRGVTVYDNLDGAPVDSPIHYMQDKRVGRSNVIVFLTVPSHARMWLVDQTPILFSMWEAMTLPEGFRESFHEFDTIIVPSRQNLELFSQYHSNVKYVPLGIDPARWHPQERPAPEREFRYLIGGSGSRKGVDLAFKAFRKVWGKEGSWGKGPVPTLTFKAPKGGEFYGERIHMMSGYITDDEETALYGQAHCYLQPSRGEGFGLQPLQAIAQGCPTILTGAHGHEAFAHLGLPLDWSPSKAAYFIFGDAGQWWEPDFDQLCDHMRDVYDNWEHHAERAAVNAKLAVDEFTWERCATGMLDAIGRERLTPYAGRDEFKVPEVKLYKLITNRDYYCEVADRAYQFYKGRVYYEIADVKRMLFEAGILDPKCLDDDHGLAPAQVERLDAYRAVNEICSQCGQRLDPDRILDEEV